MDWVNVVLVVAFVVACGAAVGLMIGAPLERGDPFAEAFGDQPELPGQAKQGDCL